MQKQPQYSVSHLNEHSDGQISASCKLSSNHHLICVNFKNKICSKSLLTLFQLLCIFSLLHQSQALRLQLCRNADQLTPVLTTSSGLRLQLPPQAKQLISVFTEDIPKGEQLWFSSRPFDSKFAKPNWMADLPDETPVSLINIPGTHDSATYAARILQFRKLSKCQTWDISEQLQAGIRYLDLRINSAGPQLLMAHGQLVTLKPFQVEIAKIQQFLAQHTSQFLILAFQKDGGTRDPSQTIISKLKDAGISAVFQNEIPKVKDLRGKVWIIRGVGIPFGKTTFQLDGSNQKIDTAQLYLQNYYSVDYSPHDSYIDIPQKVAEVTKAAFQVESSPSKLKINFLSGLGPFPPKISQNTLFPYQLALNPIGPNSKLSQALSTATKKSIIGITLMDFPGYDLIKSIIDSNFE